MRSHLPVVLHLILHERLPAAVPGVPVTPIEDPVLEAFQFAASTTRLASQPGLVTRLATAVGARDTKQFESIVVELKLQQFCIQLCHWVCALRCHVFCHCVCPPLTEAFFTHIGALGYADPTVVASQANGSGLTVADNRAFFNTLRLNGDLSVVDGAPLVEYRFEVAPTSPHGGTGRCPTPRCRRSHPGPRHGVGGCNRSAIAPTQIGSFVRSIPVDPFFEEIAVIVNNPGGSVPGVNGVLKITPSGGADPGSIRYRHLRRPQRWSRWGPRAGGSRWGPACLRSSTWTRRRRCRPRWSRSMRPASSRANRGTSARDRWLLRDPHASTERRDDG